MVRPDNSTLHSGSDQSTGAIPLASKSSPDAAPEAREQSAGRAEHYSPQEIDCRRCLEGLSTAAHDLKTPVAILSGYIELMLSEKLGPLVARQRSALQEMHDNCQRLQGFVKNFLALGAFRDSSVELQIATADLNACIAEIIQVWAPELSKKRGCAVFFSQRSITAVPF